MNRDPEQDYDPRAETIRQAAFQVAMEALDDVGKDMRRQGRSYRRSVVVMYVCAAANIGALLMSVAVQATR